MDFRGFPSFVARLHLSISSLPAFPGATYTWLTKSLLVKAWAMELPLPPESITKTLCPGIESHTGLKGYSI